MSPAVNQKLRLGVDPGVEFAEGGQLHMNAAEIIIVSQGDL
jgi:hypothetical protein